MNVLFFGTAEFGLPSLEALNVSGRHRLVAAVTGPDKPRGRGLASTPTPVGKWLAEHGITPILKPEKLGDPVFIESLKATNADAYVVVAFRILPDSVYTIPRFALNLHASLLPAYRGAAPIQRAIMAGESRTGVTTFLLQKSIDTGDVVLQRSVEIGERETAGEVMDRLSRLGAILVMETLDTLESGVYSLQPQDPNKASPAPKLRDADLFLDFGVRRNRLINHVRALAPRPGATAVFRQISVKILSLLLHDDASLQGLPGEIVAVDKTLGPIMAAGDGCVVLGSIQPAGKTPMTGAEFARGYRPQVGERFEKPTGL